MKIQHYKQTARSWWSQWWSICRKNSHVNYIVNKQSEYQCKLQCVAWKSSC